MSLRTHAALVLALLVGAIALTVGFATNDMTTTALDCVPFILCVGLTLWSWWMLGPGMRRAQDKAVEDYYQRREAAQRRIEIVPWQDMPDDWTTTTDGA